MIALGDGIASQSLTRGVAFAAFLALSLTNAAAQTPLQTSTTGGDGPFGEGQNTAGGGGNLPLPEFRGAVDLEEEYTSNATGAAQSGPADAISRLSLNLNYNRASSRFRADVNYNFTGSYYADDHDLNQLQNQLNLQAEGQIIPDTLKLTADGFASPLNVSRLGNLSAGNESVSNLNARNSYGYLVEPDYRIRLKDYADSDLTAAHGGVFFVSPNVSNSQFPQPIATPNNGLSTDVEASVKSGTYFERLRWELSASDREASQTTQSQSERQGTGTLSFALTHVFNVIGKGGYDAYRSSLPLDKDLTGPIGMGGIEIVSRPYLDLVATVGTQYNFFSYEGSLNWNIGPFTTIVGSATDQIQTPQDELLTNLGLLSPTPLGEFYNSQTQAPGPDLFSRSPDSNIVAPSLTNGLALDNSLYRMRNYSLSATNVEGRVTYSIEVLGTVRDRLNLIAGEPETRTSLYGAQVAATRQIWPDLSGTVRGGYSTAEEFGGNDQIVNADADLAYSMTERTRFFVIGRYLRRVSNNQTSVGGFPLTDVEAIVGIARQF